MGLMDLWNGFAPEEKLYIIVILAMIPVTIFGIIASVSVNTTFNKYLSVPTKAGITAPRAVERMLQENKVSRVTIVRVQGRLTDHFDPRSEQIALSDAVYPSSSIAAVSVAMHEAGHAVQHSYGYVFAKIRLSLVPVVNYMNRLFMPIMLVGMLLGFLASATFLGNIFVFLGIGMFGMSALFALVTLPTEFDASSRALESLKQSGNYSKSEISAAKKVLRAAAMTYVAAFLASLVQFLRFLAILLMNMNRRKR